MHDTAAEGRVSVDRLALLAVHLMSPEERERLVRIQGELAAQPPEQWPADLVRRLPTPSRSTGTASALMILHHFLIFFSFFP